MKPGEKYFGDLCTGGMKPKKFQKVPEVRVKMYKDYLREAGISMKKLKLMTGSFYVKKEELQQM